MPIHVAAVVTRSAITNNIAIAVDVGLPVQPPAASHQQLAIFAPEGLSRALSDPPA
jgi:hypothetical protein